MEIAIAFKCDCGCETTISGEYKELNFYLLKCVECGKTIKWNWVYDKPKFPNTKSVKIPKRDIKEEN
jgi:hypothetical protein